MQLNTFGTSVIIEGQEIKTYKELCNLYPANHLLTT